VRNSAFSYAAVSAAEDGTIAVRRPPASGLVAGHTITGELRLEGRDGTVMARAGGVHEYLDYMSVDSTGSRAAVAVTDRRSALPQVSFIDLKPGLLTPLGEQVLTSRPLWSPDGARVAYSCQPPGTMDDVCVKDLPTSQVRTLVASEDAYEKPTAWSRNGDWLLVTRYNSRVSTHLIAYSFRSGTLKPVVSIPGALVQEGVFSPDGRYVAYSSNESGRWEVSVVTFPEGTGQWQLTSEGGRVLSWGGPDDNEKRNRSAAGTPADATAIRSGRRVIAPPIMIPPALAPSPAAPAWCSPPRRGTRRMR